jgi:glycosyltransferase involved in cell wall biosynthesis
VRLLFLAEFLEQLGGCENLCASLAAAMAETGEEVMMAMAGRRIHPRWRAALGDIPCHTLDAGAPLRDLAALIASWRPDLIHAVPYERTAFALLEAGCGVPVVGTEPCDGALRCGWWYTGETLRTMLPRFDALHLLSRRARRNLREDYGWNGCGEVLPPPAALPDDLPLWSRTEPSLRLLLLGRMATEKGFETAIANLALLRAEAAPVSLELWGEGPLLEHLQRLATVAGVSAWARFRHGYSSFEEIPFQEYDALLMPSWFEGLPYVFLEALWSGLPPVVSALGGMRELPGVEELAWFFEPGRPASLIEALRALYSGYGVDPGAPARRRRLVREQCSPATVAPRYRAFYDGVLQRRR